jgi:hypothetical protein
MTEPNRAVARYDGPRTTPELREYALALAFDTAPDGAWKANQALPVAFRGNPGAVAFAVEYGKALDVSPVTALVGIHIVDGKPTASAGLISALVRRAGHKIRTWIEGTVEEGTARGITTITRADDPDFEYRSTWTLERAVRAGLCTLHQHPETGRWTVSAKGRSGRPGAWETYTENMLKSRSITECARDAVEDAIMGVHYTPEELGAEVDENGETVHVVTTVESRQEQRPAPSAPAPAQEPTPAAPAVDPVELADTIRNEILAAADPVALGEVWRSRNLTRAATEALECGDENGAETTVYALFVRAGEALKGGTRLTPDEPRPEDAAPATSAAPDPSEPVDADVVPDLDEVIEAVRKAPIREARRVLDEVMTGLGSTATPDVVAWAHGQGIDPTVNSANASLVLAAIAKGDLFADERLAAFASTGLDPLALVVEIGSSIDNRADWQRHRDETREVREAAIAQMRALAHDNPNR